MLIDLPSANNMTARFGLPAVRVVTPIAAGAINRSFFLELADRELWICRVDVENGRGKLAHEAAAYRWLWAHAPGLPVATAYHLDPSREVLPYEYALLPRLPGSNLGADLESLPGAVRDALLDRVGGLLRRLHGLVDADGELIDGHHRGQSWRDFCQDWFSNIVARCQARLGYTPPWSERARSWMAERSRLLPEAPRRVFLHGDYHFGNLQYSAFPTPRLTGCFDLEWAWSGHAACDLLHLREAVARYPAYEGPLLAGYGAATWPEELVVYRLIHSISVMAAAVAEHPEPLWDLLAWHGIVIDNVLNDREPFARLLT